MDRGTSVSALAVVTTLAVIVAIYPILPTNGQPFSEFGVLGPDQTLGRYPTTAAIGQQFTLYAFVGNHEGEAKFYQIMVKQGNTTTAISNSTAANLPPLLTHSIILKDNSSATLPMPISMTAAGLNQRLIFELWMLNSTTSRFVYTGLWTQIWLNVTAY